MINLIHTITKLQLDCLIEQDIEKSITINQYIHRHDGILIKKDTTKTPVDPQLTAITKIRKYDGFAFVEWSYSKEWCGQKVILKQKEKYNMSGKMHGLQLYYYHNGKLHHEANYINGKKDGVFTWYDLKGNIMNKCLYKNNILQNNF